MIRKILVLLIMVLLGAGLWWCAHLPIWNIQEVQIVGHGYIPPELIRERTNRWRNTSILMSTKQNLQLDIIWVEDYHIRRHFFPARLTVEIQPRMPVFAVPINNQLCILDAQGRVLNQIGVIVPTENVLRVVPLNNWTEVDFLVKNLLPLYDYLGNIFQYADLKLDISRRNNIQVIVKDRLVLKFGQAVDLEQKYTALASVLADVRPFLDRIQYIDVSSYRTPAVK